MEFIDYENYAEINGSNMKVFGELFVDNNVMKGSNDYDIWYEGYSKLEFKTKLMFKTQTAITNNAVNVAELQDMNGNSIRISQINVILTNKNDSTSANINLTYSTAAKGYSLSTAGLKLGEYTLSGSTLGLATNCNVIDGNLKIIDIVLSSKGVTKVYGTSNKLIINLVDNNGNALAGESIKVVLSNGVTKNIKTNSKGQATLAIDLAPGQYSAKISFNGKQATSKILVKRATPKLVAAKKVFKRTLKIKQYTVTLKNNLGKAMKNTNVVLKVCGKTFKAKTNSKGQATFKITKLTKKGVFNAKVAYAGNKYYNAKTVSTKITLR